MGWSDPQERERLRELVAQVLEEFEEHGEVAVERACSSHPELAAALRARIDALRRIGLVGSGSGSGAGAPDGRRADESGEPIPERLGDFKLLRRLGRGGMGVVYLAEQESLKRKVALKLVRPELLFFAQSRERFRREVEVVAKLNHPGIVPVYAVDAEAEVPWFAMEWVDGVSLDELLAALEGKDAARLTGEDLARAIAPAPAEGADARPADREDAGLREFAAGSWVDACLRLVRQAALALQHAHERGVVHRDLKPSNFMLTRDGRVRLVDFGLASTEGTTKITKSSSQLGSLPYTSPEQLERGIAAVDARSDTYALGCVLFELLTLKPAYFEDEPEATRRRILAAQHATIRALNPNVTWDAETACLTAMERDPARRYASAGEFARDLQRVLDFEPIAARRASAGLRLKRFAQRRPALAVGGLLGALLVIGGPTIWAVQEHRYGSRLAQANLALGTTNTQLGIANGDLAAAKQKIEEQLIEEKAARAAAARSAERAREAIVEFLGKVGDSVLANVPGAAAIRRDLLQRATEQFELLVADSGADATARLQMANAFRLLGVRHAELGDVVKARAAFARGLELVDSVPADSPSCFEARRKRADLLLERAIVAEAQEHDDVRALADADEAIALYRELLERDEFRAWSRAALGNVLSIRGQVLASMRRFDEAAASLEESVAVLTESVQRGERAADARATRLAARGNLGSVFEHADRPEEAEQAYRALLADVTAEVAADPRDAWRRFVVAATSSNLALVLVRLEQQEEAEAFLRDAIAAYEALVKDFSLPLHRRELGRNLVHLADAVAVTKGSGDEELVPLLERANQLLEPLAAPGQNGDNIAQLAFAGVLRRLAALDFAAGEPSRALARLGRAAALAAALAARDPSSWECHELVAQVERAYVSAPADALPDDERTGHAAKGFAAAAQSVRCCGDGVTPSARDELLNAFDALAALADADAAARERASAAARELLALLPADAQAARRAEKFQGSGG